MNRVKHRWFWAWNFEKEEKWLNKMALEGFDLCKVGFCTYEFQECKPGEYKYKIFVKKDISIENKSIQPIGNVFLYKYFREKASEKNNKINNLDSFILHLKKLKNIFLLFILILVISGSKWVGNLFNILVKHKYNLLDMSIGFFYVILYVLFLIGIIQIFIKLHLLKKSRLEYNNDKKINS